MWKSGWVVCFALAGCATTSFAPPDVTLTCDDSKGACTGKLKHALADIDKFITAYRSQANDAGNSRQWFDVPAIVAGVGGATALALGANADVAIGTGAFGALAATGRSYYAPGEQADAYADALSAFICIQQEVVGLNKSADALKSNAKTSVSLDEEYRAYVTVRNAALKVENTTRQRLATRGTIEGAEAISELVTKYRKQAENGEERAKFGRDETDPDFAYRINLETLAPKLDICALIAKG